MRRDFLLTTHTTPTARGVAALAVAVAGTMVPLGQAGAQVAPPATQGPEAVRLNNGRSGVEGTVKAPMVTASGVNADWLPQLRSGQLSPEEAWQRGLLTAANTTGVIWSQELAAAEHKALRLRLAGLLAERAPEVLGPRNGADRELKRVAGDYFRSQKDERAVGFLEAALEELLQDRQAQMKSRTAGDVARKGDPKWITPLGNLAMFYSETGQFLKSAQTWSRAKEFSTHPAWMADALVETARAYAQAGQADKAKESYAKVAQYGQGYYTGMAVYDQAIELMQRGHLDEARALLAQPIAITGSKFETIKVALLSASGQLHYLAGEWAEAKRDSQSALQQFEAMPTTERRIANLSAVINMTQARMRWSEQWLKAPLVVEPNQLNVTVRQGQTYNEPFKRSVFVHSARPVPLEVTTNNEGVTARVEGDTESNEYFYQRKIALEVRPQSFTKMTEVVLKVKSPQFPDLSLSVPLIVEVQSAIEVSPSSLFFGEVAASKSAIATVELSAPMPFRILSVTPDDAALKVEADAEQMPGNQPATRHTLRLKFTLPQVGTLPQAGRFYTGTLRLTTDAPGQEVIEVLYAARAK